MGPSGACTGHSHSTRAGPDTCLGLGGFNQASGQSGRRVRKASSLKDRAHATDQAVGHGGHGSLVWSVPTRNNALTFLTLLRVFVSHQPATGSPSCTWGVRTAHR